MTKVRAEFSTNQGASVARNRGTDLAQGKFIQYLDADDLLRPSLLFSFIKTLELPIPALQFILWKRAALCCRISLEKHIKWFFS
ncbi:MULTISPECIES: glycosyltransferase family A protein [unclassified Nostoc]|uniref:glycosyltransferase family A protein n=1 Tax=unclassified Nostoc TaxID=2593658 RepID=UPI000B950C5E|nr:hypothetical protein CDG79_03125 [Nostoc sp. 'Peltigera membranacea cyanobiont' 232]